MSNFIVHFRDGSTATFAAARYETDGSGTRFYDEAGGTVASFYDGEARRVLPASATIILPAEGGE